MVALTSPSPVTVHLVFDSEGRRIADYNETSSALIRENVWNGWEPVAVIEGGVVSFIRTNNIGRPVFATNSSVTKVWTASYLPFGGVRVSTGTPTTLRFPGQWFQSETGLYQNWMRDYDPNTGRYLQADPLGLIDGASVYGYVGAEPGEILGSDGRKQTFKRFHRSADRSCHKETHQGKGCRLCVEVPERKLPKRLPSYRGRNKIQ